MQYPFGFGLSYTSFSYKWEQPIKQQYEAKDKIKVFVSIANGGTMDGAEVAQAYLQYPSGDRMPLKELKAFSRLWIPAGQHRQLQLSIPVKELQKWDLRAGKWKLYRYAITGNTGSSSAAIPGMKN